MLYGLLVLLTFLFAFQSLFCRLYSEAYLGPDKDIASTVYSIIYGVVVGALSLAMNGFVFAPSAATVGLGLLNACMLYLYNASMVNGGVRGSYGFLMICSLSGGMLVPIIWDAAAKGQMLAGTEIAALVLLIASAVLMNLKGISRSSDWKYYAWCAVLFLSNGFYGTLMNIQQAMMNGDQRAEMIVITYMAMGLAALAITAAKQGKGFASAFRMGKKAAAYAVGACVAATVASNMLLYLIANFNNITFLYAFNNGSVLVVSAVMAAILFREKLLPPRLAGIALACAGIVLLCL